MCWFQASMQLCLHSETHDFAKLEQAIWEDQYIYCQAMELLKAVSSNIVHGKRQQPEGTLAENISRQASRPPQNCHKCTAETHNKAICRFQLVQYFEAQEISLLERQPRLAHYVASN